MCLRTGLVTGLRVSDRYYCPRGTCDWARRSVCHRSAPSTPASCSHTADVTVTPATLVAELLRLFPPVQTEDAPHPPAPVPPLRETASSCFRWETLFLVRQQEVNGLSSWHRRVPAGGVGGLVQSRSGLWCPRGTVATRSRWRLEMPPQRSAAAAVASNCTLSCHDNAATVSDAVLRVWHHSLAYMHSCSKRPEEQATCLYGWSTPAVYAMYHYDALEAGGCLSNAPRLVGTYYAIPGLPQPPPNVSASLATLGTADEAVQGSVLPLAAYLAFVIPSYQPGSENQHADTEVASGVAAAPQHFLFDSPRHFRGSPTTRGRLANRQAFWQNVPLRDYLREWPSCSLAPATVRAGSACDRDGCDVDTDSVPGTPWLVSRYGVAVLLLLETAVWYFSLVMHVHNPFLPTRADVDASLAASACFAFIHAPRDECAPARLREYLHRVVDSKGKVSNIRAGCSLQGDTLPCFTPHNRGWQERLSPPHTVLVRDEEDKQYRLPYHTTAQCTCQATFTTKQRSAAETHNTRSTYMVHWRTREDQRERAREALLCAFLSRRTDSSSHSRARRTLPHPVVFSPFPPPKALLRNPAVFSRPHAVAEEMRYGRLIRHT